MRESLVSIGRLLIFVANEAEGMRWAKDQRAQLKSMQRDAQSLSDHATYLTNNITFLLDAMLGVVTIEQNNIIKIFSVAAVAFMPPTLIASIYGMNFKHMPELDWQAGYPFAIVLMLVAAILPFRLFQMAQVAVMRGSLPLAGEGDNEFGVRDMSLHLMVRSANGSARSAAR